MTRKILWLAVSGLMALSLVLAACSPAATPTTPTAPSTPTTPTSPSNTTKPVEEPTQKEVLTPATGLPQYGGTITYRLGGDPTSFDSGAGRSAGATLYGFVYQHSMTYDWGRGPAGSGVTNYAAFISAVDDIMMPQLAESWQMPQQGVWILKIRQGVRWQPVPSEAGRLMAGREVTANDFVSSFNRMIGPDAWIQAAQPAVAKSASINQTGPWEVTIRTPVDHFTGLFWLVFGSSHNALYPPEVVAKYGNVSNWRNAVGTGPFMLTEYVPGSQLYYLRNPNYWEADPLGPGKSNKLPYADAVRALIIPDLSTTLAALRTGKLDYLESTTIENGQSVMKTSPKIEYLTFIANSYTRIAMRLDNPALPFANLKVRQALKLATDFEALKRDYYGGQAEIDVVPANINFKGSGYVPIEEMPQSVRDLYTYNPEKAKQLLKEAGYPTGFKADILVSSAGTNADEVAIYKDMWAKVGVELNILVREPTIYSTISNARTWEHMIYGAQVAHVTGVWSFSSLRGTQPYSPSRTDDAKIRTDPVIEASWAIVDKNLLVDMPKVYDEYKKLSPYVLEQAFEIPRPTPYSYSLWWPWLKNYYGQGTFHGGFLRYAWIDQELKKAIGF